MNELPNEGILVDFNSKVNFVLLEINSSSSYLWRRQWQPTPVLSPGKSHGRRSLVGCSPSGRYESGTTERLHFHFSLSCIGEGNGNPLQYSCLVNPRDGGAWWAAVYGVAQSRTRLTWLSSHGIEWEAQNLCTQMDWVSVKIWYFQMVWFWKSYLNFLSFHFPSCKVSVGSCQDSCSNSRSISLVNNSFLPFTLQKR